MVVKGVEFRELHFSDDLSIEEKKINKQLENGLSEAKKKELNARLQRVHNLQEQMKTGKIADAYVSVMMQDNFDVVDFIENFSEKHKVNKKRKKGGLLGVLKGLGLSTALFAAGFMSNGEKHNETRPERNDKAAITVNINDAELAQENDFMEMGDAINQQSPDIHAFWRGQFAEARDSGKIDQANNLSTREGWHMPIDQNSVLWSVFSMNTPEFQKAYNGLDEVSRTYYNGYLDMVARGLQEISMIQSPVSAHKNTADVNALFEANFLSYMDSLLKADFTKDQKGHISQEAHNTLVDYQLFQTASEQVLGPALSIYLMPEYGYESIKTLQQAVAELKDRNAGSKLLSKLNSKSKSSKKSQIRGPIAGRGR